MIGSWRWNAGFGGFGAALTFLLSLANNPIGTTLLRSLYGFFAFAILAFALRFVLGLLLLPPSATDRRDKPTEERGAVLDLVTPDEGDELSDILKEQWTGGKDDPAPAFRPLRPKRLVSLDDADAEQVVQAVRRLTDE